MDNAYKKIGAKRGNRKNPALFAVLMLPISSFLMEKLKLRCVLSI